MLRVDGLRLGKRTRFAFDQSTNDALSWDSKNLRSSASDLKRGLACLAFPVFCFIVLPFTTAHLARGNHADAGNVIPERERDVKTASFHCTSQCMKPWFPDRVPVVFDH